MKRKVIDERMERIKQFLSDFKVLHEKWLPIDTLWKRMRDEAAEYKRSGLRVINGGKQ